MFKKTRLAVLFALGALLLGAAPGGALAQSCLSWQETARAPDARNQHVSAYDSARGVTVVFGGFNGGYSGETWEYNGSTWTLRSTSGPFARIQGAMAYDAARGVCVLFGGDVFGPGDDTWEWNGTVWTYRAVAGPPGRLRHAMAYDSARQRIVLYGGFDGTVRLDDTWEWDGTAWTQVNLAGPRPAARSTPSMAFDAARGVSVLFGGFVPAVGYSDETWEWNGTAWTQRAVAGPPGRALAQLAYDSARSRTVLFGGGDAVGERADTWEWDGTAWTQRATNGLAPRASHSMVFDSARARAVVFGGSTGTDLLGDVQEWDGTVWTERLVGAPPGRYGAGMCYDTVRNTTVMFAGEWDGPILQDDMWERTTVGWVKRNVPRPTARTGQAMVFDPVRNETLLFGGYTLGAPGGDETWVWNGTAWTQRLVAGPSARYTPGAAFDSARGVVVLFGGHTPTGDVGDTWEWNGTAWTERVIAGPSPRVNSAMIYDPQRGVCVLFGGGAAGGPYLSDTWEYDGTAWTQRPIAGPSGRYGHTMVYDPVRQVSVLFGGRTATAESAEHWEYNGTAWTQRTTSGPSARVFHHAVYDNARGLMMLYGGRPASGLSGETWHLNADGPMVATGPSPQDACEGSPASFSVTASGTGPYTYRWRRNGVDLSNGGGISGATTANLSITSVAAGNAGSYDCVITNDCGSATSAAAALAVSTAPSLSQQPVAVAVCAGQNANFAISATGTAPLSYQWRRNGVVLSNGGGIAGATSASLQLTGVNAASAGNYDCVVTNTCRSTTSTAAALTINAPVGITQSPASASVCDGQPTSFTVAASGAGPLSYQWRRNGANLSNGGGISGATSATLGLAAAAGADAGTYDCVVTNVCGSATSGSAMLAVNTAPSISQSPSGTTICAGQPLSLGVTAGGTAPLSYQWRRDGVNLADGAGVSGATTATLAIAAIAENQAGNFDCVVTNACGSATSTAAAVAVQAAVAVTQSPAGATRCEGQSVSFSVTAAGAGPLTYQWRKDGVAITVDGRISGAATATLSISSIDPTDGASYDCVITGVCGAVTSTAATLVVNNPPLVSQQPAPAAACPEQPATFTVAATGTGPLSYQWRRNGVTLSDGPGISGATTATLALGAVAAGDAGSYDCVITNTCGSSTSTAAALTVNQAPQINTQPQAATLCAAQPAAFTVAATGAEPLSYQWRRNGVNLADGAGISGATSASLSLAAVAAGDAGSYDCVITNACGSTTSSAAALAVDAAPAIGTNPLAATVCSGQPAAFTVTATGTAPLSYQWRRNGVNLSDGAGISGATSASLSLAAVAAGDAGSYDCVITNACGSTTSSAAVLTVDVAPVVGTQPAPATQCAGQPAAFTVAATGTAPLSYQWRRNGVNLADGAGISGATTASLGLAAVAAGDAGLFDCVITNACGAATSNAAALVVDVAPVVGTQPLPATACAGQPAGFSVAATGTEPLTYQWRRNGVNLADGAGISGATAATLSLAAVAIGDDGAYDCVITNSCGSVTSNTASLGVQAAPSIGTQPAAAAHCVGQPAVFTVAATGSGTLSYQWRRNGVNLADGVGISGATAATLSLASVAEADGGTFDCVVTNGCGSTTSNAGALTVNVGPAIGTQPVAATHCVGQPAVFSVSATGTAPLSYQWRRNGVNLADGAGISGAATATLSLASVAEADGGTFDCVVTNACGSTTSNAAALTVDVAPSIGTQPVAATHCVGQPAVFSVSATGTAPLSYQWRRNGVNLADGAGISGATAATLSLASVAEADSGSFDCVVSNGCGSTTSNAVALAVNVGPAIGTQPAAATLCAGQPAAFSVSATGTAPLSYQWRRNGVNLADGAGVAGATTASLSLASVATADAGSYDCVVTNACGSTTSNTAALTVDVAPSIGTQPVAATHCVGQPAAFSIAATGTAPLSYQWRRNGVNLADGAGTSGATAATLSLASVAEADGGTFDCVVTNGCGSTTSNAVALAVNVGPAIGTQPVPSTHCAGQPAAFSVSATGTGPLSYQWRRNGVNLADGAGISGATAANLTLAAVVPGDAGSYDCVVTNVCGTTTSSAATLSVDVGPAIGTQPGAATHCVGQPAAFSVSATGTAPLSYQWRRNGVNLADSAGISGATTASLSLAAVAAGDAGSYDCVVTNACGSATSNAAALTVDAPTAISTQPVPVTQCVAQGAAFSVIASGAGTLDYQWRRNGVNLSDGSGITGSNSPALSFTSLLLADAGSIDCVVTGACGSATSDAVALTVNPPTTISQQPVAQTLCENANASFSTGAAGAGSLVYQWRRNAVQLADGGRIAGATTASLTITGVLAADAGSYDCVVTGACGPITTSAATLTVNISPTISLPPAAQAQCTGQSATLTVAAGGTEPMTYQWRRNGEPVADGAGISGAATAALQLTGLNAASAGSYDCVVTNACGSATSAAAVLTINTPPAIDTPPAALTRCVGAGATFTVAASGTAPLSYQWRRGGVNLADGQGLSGATTATLAIASVAIVDAGSYDCVVTNPCGSITAAAADLTVQTPPSLITQPQPAAHCAGQPSGFSVAAVGSGPLAYQWRRDGVNLTDGANIVGSGTPTLTIANVATADAGSYDCVVTGPCGSVTSSGAPLTVNTPPFIGGNPEATTRCTGQAATLTVTATGTGPLSYQWRRDGAAITDGAGISGSATATLTVNGAVAGNAGSFDCVVTNACGSATSAAAPVAFNAAPTITEQPAGHKRCAGQPEVLIVAASGTEPMTYQWRKDGVNLVDAPGISGTTTTTLVISSVAAADEGAYVCVVTNSCGSTPSASAFLSVSQPAVVLTQPLPAEKCVNETASFSVSANGVAPLTYQWRRNGVNLVNGGPVSGATSATLSIFAITTGDAGNYDCVVTNPCGSVTSTAAALTVRSAPQIAQHPVPQTPCGGGGVSFTVTATGSAPLAYQWRRDGVNLADGGTISGATSATLTITGVTVADNGSYDCVVTNTCGNAACSPATLTASPGPTFSQQPQNTDVFAGSTASLTATASGPGTLTYQWRRNGVDLVDGGRISGATTASLTITAAVLADAGSYTVVVTSSTCGAATSQPATLAVFCRADFDRNGIIDPADVSFFVSTWFADLQNGTLNADFDRSGATDPADVSALVAAWFAAVSAGGC